MQQLAYIQQRVIPTDLLAPMAEFTGEVDHGTVLLQSIEDDGYVLLRGVLDRDTVFSAREEVFQKLQQVGEVRPPAIDGISTGESRRREIVGDLNDFWCSVSEGVALRRVTHGHRLHELMGLVLGGPSRAHDLIYLRPAAVGRSTRLHYDFPFFARRSLRIYTAWIPIGDIPRTDGSLVIVEGSNRFSDLIDPIRQYDYQSDHSDQVIQQAAYEKPNSTDPITFVQQRGTRLLSADFRAGDLLIFSGFTLHGSLDNCSEIGRIRLSCDLRYQLEVDPFDDERYFGSHPTGSNGGGYGDMKGAKPLTDPW